MRISANLVSKSHALRLEEKLHVKAHGSGHPNQLHMIRIDETIRTTLRPWRGITVIPIFDGCLLGRLDSLARVRTSWRTSRWIRGDLLRMSWHTIVVLLRTHILSRPFSTREALSCMTDLSVLLRTANRLYVDSPGIHRVLLRVPLHRHCPRRVLACRDASYRFDPRSDDPSTRPPHTLCNV